jgi:hypothetical protein
MSQGADERGGGRSEPVGAALPSPLILSLPKRRACAAPRPFAFLVASAAAIIDDSEWFSQPRPIA